MPSYTPPSFQERTALAAKARQAALDKLKAKAPPSEAEVAERIAAQAAREAAQAAARAEKIAAREAEKAEREAAKAQAAAEEAARIEAASIKAPVLSEEEKKALRDARYAARKKRKGR
ncbi:DUF6481 family protein [Novosphingobium lentum]|uniref:DUF6481 family protein n=1 Tax=Novosphingobium lentum TaxID=145287 RepID=UPI000836F0D4|nr:DUF6481 family protein [Novosphingobium lentum]